MDVEECLWDSPDEICTDQTHDAVVYCAKAGGGDVQVFLHESFQTFAPCFSSI